MKLLMTADTVGGVFTYALDLATELAGAGDEVVLVTFGRRASVEQRRRIATACVADWHESELALEWMDDPWSDLNKAGQLLLEIEAEERPDVIQLNAYGHAALDWRAPVVVVAHSCVFSWWEAVHRDTPPPEWTRYRRWVRDGLGAADAVVAPSRTMLDAVQHHYGRLSAPGVVIANGSAVPLAPADVVKRPFALAAGRLWDAGKNLALLAGASVGLAPGSVRVAGEGADGAKAGGLEMLGPLSARSLARERREAAVFAAPARYEPFGLAVLEAARDRCALVLGDIPSLRELWGPDALYVSPDDPEQLAGALRMLLDDLPAAAELGDRVQHRAERNYARPAMAGAYRHLYATVAAGDREVMAR
jgi:glycogen(starch) synthase